ncbi:MAG: EF-hand domain-containing protein [Pseudomonadota bacterium]
MFEKKTAFGLVLAISVPAFAVAATELDSNGDGLVSPAEFQEAMPEAPEGTFEQLDVNGDGALNEAEVAAAREAGIIPA